MNASSNWISRCCVGVAALRGGVRPRAPARPTPFASFFLKQSGITLYGVVLVAVSRIMARSPRKGLRKTLLSRTADTVWHPTARTNRTFIVYRQMRGAVARRQACCSGAVGWVRNLSTPNARMTYIRLAPLLAVRGPSAAPAGSDMLRSPVLRHALRHAALAKRPSRRLRPI